MDNGMMKQLMGVAQQVLGRAPTPQDLQDPKIMQLLTQALDQSNSPSAGMRDNFDWVDAQMPGGMGEKAPAAANASMNRRATQSTGKSDRLDAQEVPLPPSRPDNLGDGRTMEAPLPPRRPADLERTAPKAADDEAGDRESLRTLARGNAAQRSDIAPTATPAMKSPEAAGRVPTDAGMDADVLKAIEGYNETQPTDSYFGPDTGKNTNYREEVSGMQKDIQKIAQAGIDPSKLSQMQIMRISTMGVDKWLAEQLDQQARDTRRSNTKRAQGAAAAKK
jgi:hypothetical protein